MIRTTSNRVLPEAAARSALACIAASLLACAPGGGHSIGLEFAAKYQGHTPTCTSPMADDLEMTDLRFFVSDVEVGNGSSWSAASGQRVHLLDFENGEGSCTNGTPAMHSEIALNLPKADVSALRFTLGVPFDLNHGDPLLAEPPLDEPAMFWHWRSGHKFLRVGVKNRGTRWHAHLGSVGCLGPIAAIESCERPNRRTITLTGFTPGDTIVINLDVLLADINTRDDASAHCLSEADNPACKQLGRNLGIDFSTGTSAGETSVFSLAPN